MFRQALFDGLQSLCGFAHFAERLDQGPGGLEGIRKAGHGEAIVLQGKFGHAAPRVDPRQGQSGVQVVGIGRQAPPQRASFYVALTGIGRILHAARFYGRNRGLGNAG
jgi:hypothetical protein